MKKYNVIYTENHKHHTEVIEADNPGKAFYFCKRNHPGAVMIKCFREGFHSMLGSDFGYTEWEAPKNQDLPSFNQKIKNKQVQLTLPL